MWLDPSISKSLSNATWESAFHGWNWTWLRSSVFWRLEDVGTGQASQIAEVSQVQEWYAQHPVCWVAKGWSSMNWLQGFLNDRLYQKISETNNCTGIELFNDVKLVESSRFVTIRTSFAEFLQGPLKHPSLSPWLDGDVAPLAPLKGLCWQISLFSYQLLIVDPATKNIKKRVKNNGTFIILHTFHRYIMIYHTFHAKLSGIHSMPGSSCPVRFFPHLHSLCAVPRCTTCVSQIGQGLRLCECNLGSELNWFCRFYYQLSA